MEELNSESMESRIIKTQDENGEIHNFELIDVIHLDDRDYGLLVHLDGEEGAEDEESEEEIVIMRLEKIDDAYTFETIEDDDEFNRIVTYLESEGSLEFDEDEDVEE